jgi:hypothetical protein
MNRERGGPFDKLRTGEGVRPELCTDGRKGVKETEEEELPGGDTLTCLG